MKVTRRKSLRTGPEDRGKMGCFWVFSSLDMPKH